MKKLILLALLLCTVMQAGAAEWTDSNGIKWYFNVSGSNATDIQQNMGWGQLSGDIEIPGTVYDGETALTVTSIAAFGFMSCSGLTSVTIPSSVTSIGDMAFNGCSSLTNVYCHAETPPTITSGVFDTYDATLYVPASSQETYQSAEVWKDFSHIEPLPIYTTTGDIRYSLSATGEAMVIQGNYQELTSVNIPPPLHIMATLTA